MKFGKLQDISGVDFSLPQIPASTQALLQASAASKTAVYFGCTGWAMKDWVGSYYPAKAKTSDYLKHYAKQFNTIELNTTHYRIPTPAMIQKWYDLSSEGFKFAPKVPQAISHRNDLGLSDTKIEAFCQAVLGLKEKLGVIFMQLPPTFDVQKQSILRRFLERFPTREVALTIEFRHPSWFEPTNFAACLDLLAAHQVGTVITDVAGRRDVLHLGLTTPSIALRFVGNDLHQTDYERIDAWVDLLKPWINQGLSSVYFFMHQPDNIKTPEACTYLVEQVNKVWELDLCVPREINSGQMKLF